MTVFVDISTAVIDALSADPAVSANIFRARDRAMAEEYLTAVNVQVGEAVADGGVMLGSPVDWETSVAVECYAKSSTVSGDVAVDPLLDAVYARIAADTSLGGLVDNIQIRAVKFEFDSQAQKTGWAGITFTAYHRTSNLTLG